MDKKKTSLVAVISIGLVIVLGFCFMKFGDQDRQDKRDETQNVSATEPTVEPGIEPATEPSEETEYDNSIETLESIRQFFDAITDEISLPCEPIRIISDIGFTDGDFEIAGYDYENYGVAEIEEVMDYPSEEEIAALGIQEDMLAYWLVLNNKKPFVSTNEDGQKFYWNEFYWYFGSLAGRHQADYFMIVDMDGDGTKEVVLECSPESTQVLHYEDGEVYSYQFVFRGMKRILKSGIYEGSDGAASTSYYRLTELDKDGYTEETLAVMDDDYYEVEGIEATYEEFCDYVDSIESVEQADCMKFTENMLDRQLLGSLSEQELALVKRISTENMLENEPDYEEHKQVLKLYAAALSGEEDIIYVTGDTRPGGDDPVIMYFSIVDMDGDGVCELVFFCYYSDIQVLHYEKGKVYCYQLKTDTFDIAVITTDGVFQTRDSSPAEYARIVAFEQDGYRAEPVKNYDSSRHERVRYYFYSEETIAQWLE